MRMRPARTGATLALLLQALATGCGGAPPASEPLPFQNPDLPIDARVDDLVGRLTLDEKATLMIERAAPIERLGIPAFPWWNEALHGVARAGRATVFPQAIGLAATWDTGLMHRVATAIADEARAMNNRWRARGQRHLYQGLTFWSPNINIFRDPRWGRGQETYGEDPTLTGAMGVAFVTGMQGDDPRYLKTIATPKHYAVHSGPEPGRHTFDARVSEADLGDTYLAAFRATVVVLRGETPNRLQHSRLAPHHIREPRSLLMDGRPVQHHQDEARDPEGDGEHDQKGYEEGPGISTQRPEARLASLARAALHDHSIGRVESNLSVLGFLPSSTCVRARLAAGTRIPAIRTAYCWTAPRRCVFADSVCSRRRP